MWLVLKRCIYIRNTEGNKINKVNSQIDANISQDFYYGEWFIELWKPNSSILWYYMLKSQESWWYHSSLLMWRPRNAEKGEARVVVRDVWSEKPLEHQGFWCPMLGDHLKERFHLNCFFILAFNGLNDCYSDTHWMKVDLFVVQFLNLPLTDVARNNMFTIHMDIP